MRLALYKSRFSGRVVCYDTPVSGTSEECAIGSYRSRCYSFLGTLDGIKAYLDIWQLRMEDGPYGENTRRLISILIIENVQIPRH